MHVLVAFSVGQIDRERKRGGWGGGGEEGDGEGGEGGRKTENILLMLVRCSF